MDAHRKLKINLLELQIREKTLKITSQYAVHDWLHTVSHSEE